MDDARRRQVVEAFRRRRWTKARTYTTSELTFHIGSVAIGVLVALAVWAYFGERGTKTDIWLPLISGSVASVLIEGGRLIYRYVWAVPEQEHVDVWHQIDWLTVRLDEYTTPRAELRYDPEHVRYGTLTSGDERRHIIDVVNMSGRPLKGCRLVLEGSVPDEAHVTYPGALLGDRVGNNGVFTLNPGNRSTPTFQIDALHEVTPTMNLGSPGGPSLMRYLYAEQAFASKSKWFQNKVDRIVVLRLDSEDLPEAVWLRLLVRYVDGQYEVSVATDSTLTVGGSV